MSDQGRRSSSPLRTPQPGASHAWRHGIRRVSSAPAVLLGAWLVTMIASLPFMLLMRGLLLEHLGASLAADTAASGINYDWMQEFAAQASGVGRTFRPAVIGFAAVLDNLSAFIDNSRPASLVAIALMYSGLWLFLAGGVINRFARDRATHSHGFFMASGVFFLRFLRLGLLMAAVYGALAYFTDSTLPSMVLHAGGNMFSAFDVFTRGRSEWQLATAPRPLIWETGPDAVFWGNLAALVNVGALVVWAYSALAGAARAARASSAL